MVEDIRELEEERQFVRPGKRADGDVVELQPAHLDNSTVEGLYKKHGPLALIGSRTKLMQALG